MSVHLQWSAPPAPPSDVPDPVTFFASRFELLQLPCPLKACVWDGASWNIEFDQDLMEGPSLTARRNAAAKDAQVFPNFNGPLECREMPKIIYHGTTLENLAGIMIRGRFGSSQELGRTPHQPDGVYGYADKAISSQSGYVQPDGCQLWLRVVGVATSARASSSAAWCPEGLAMVLGRGQYKARGAAGYEWVFHPRSILIERVEIGYHAWKCFVARECSRPAPSLPLAGPDDQDPLAALERQASNLLPAWSLLRAQLL
jgi:hypothetical protein